MDINFNSLEELYRRIKPALITKKEEMNRGLYPYIEEEDIWNYLKEVKWKKTLDLSLSEMVNDILNCDDILIDNYLKTKLNRKKELNDILMEEKMKKKKLIINVFLCVALFLIMILL